MMARVCTWGYVPGRFNMSGVGVSLSTLSKWHWFVVLQHFRSYAKVCGVIPRTSTSAHIRWQSSSASYMANYWALAYRAGVGRGTIVWSAHPNKRGRYTQGVLISLHCHENYHLLANTSSQIGTWPISSTMETVLRRLWGPPVYKGEEDNDSWVTQGVMERQSIWRMVLDLFRPKGELIALPFSEDGNDSVQLLAAEIEKDA